MKKLNIGGATNAPPKKKTTHPEVDVTGTRLEELIKQFIVVAPEAIRLENQRKALSGDIGAESRPLFFHRFAGVVPDSSTMIAKVNGTEVKLIVQEKYSQNVTDDTHLIAAIGKDKVEKYFHWRTKYAVDYDQIPEALQEKFAEAIEKARVELGVPAEAVSAKQFLEPNAGFHAARTTLLTEDENERLDTVMPVVAFPKLG